jgi:carboxyl-terminal processing protease
MRLWIAAAVILTSSAFAHASGLEDEAAYWRSVDMQDCPVDQVTVSAIAYQPQAKKNPLCAPLIKRFVDNDLCYSSSEWLFSCVNAINKGGQLLAPPVRVDSDGQRLKMVSGEPPHQGPTLRQMFEARKVESRRLKRLVAKQFQIASADKSLRFDFEGELFTMGLRLPAGLPVQMLWGRAIDGQLSTFDAHAYILPTTLAKHRREDSSKDLVGVGINLDFLPRGVLVHQVFADSPAARAGVRPDDQILEVAKDGAHFKSVEGLNPEEIYDLLSGEGLVGLRVRRDSQTPYLIFERGLMHIPLVDAALLPDDIGYVVLRSFSALDSCSTLSDLTNDLVNKKGAKKLILDLRGNMGGSILVAECVASLFVGNRKVVGTMAIDLNVPSLHALLPAADLSDGTIHWERGPSAQAFFQPLVVLVDSISASAAEVVAGAIQYHRSDAWIVGERTEGKGTGQNLDSPEWLPSIKIVHTAFRLYLADGRSLQRVGVTPNFDVPLRYGASPEERYYPREADLYPNALRAATASTVPWNDPREEMAEPIRACITQNHLDQQELQALVATGERADYQKAYAQAVLKCF